MAYSKIKKVDVYSYFEDKLILANFGVINFDMDSFDKIQYKPMADDDNKLSRKYETDDDTYLQIITDKIPVGVGSIGADFQSIRSIDSSELIDSSDFNVVLSFLLFLDNPDIHRLQMLSLEQFRDSLIANLDTIKVTEINYANITQETVTYQTVATNCEDIQIGSVLEINGSRFLECSLQIDMSTSKTAVFGNQFQFYLKDEEDITFTRIMPLIVSFGVSTTLTSAQLLRNDALTEDRMKFAQTAHALVASRGYAVTMSFVLEDKVIIENLFTETYPYKDDMNNAYDIKMEYKKKTIVGGVPIFQTYAPMGWEVRCIVAEASASEIQYGDLVSFVIGFNPKYEGEE